MSSTLECGKIADRENNQGLRQVKDAIRIRQSPQVMNQDKDAYNLSNIYKPLFTICKESCGKLSTSCDITRSRSQSDDGSR